MKSIWKSRVFDPDYVEVWGVRWYPFNNLHLILAKPIYPSRNELNYMKRFAIRIGKVLLYNEYEVRKYLEERCSIDRWLQIGERVPEPQEVMVFRYEGQWYIRNTEFNERFKYWRDNMSRYRVTCYGRGFFIAEKLKTYLKTRNLPFIWIDELIKEHES